MSDWALVVGICYLMTLPFAFLGWVVWLDGRD